MGRVNIIILFVLVCVFSGCSDSGSVNSGLEEVDSLSSGTVERYQENEIREYQGTNLDPSIGPRDNSIKGVQYVDISSYTLKITGLVENETVYTYDDILAFEPFQKLITLYCVEGWDATILWEGVLITDLLYEADYDESADTLIFKSVDGYTTSLPIADIIEKNMIAAYYANGIELPPQMGYPLIIVAEDKLGYKWARWVNEIEVSSDTDYEGYWESRGYDNDADIP